METCVIGISTESEMMMWPYTFAGAHDLCNHRLIKWLLFSLTINIPSLSLGLYSGMASRYAIYHTAGNIGGNYI